MTQSPERAQHERPRQVVDPSAAQPGAAGEPPLSGEDVVGQSTVELVNELLGGLSPEVSDRLLDAGETANRHPARIGRYEIREKVGSGGYGVVFRAVDTVGGGLVALKCPRLSVYVDEHLRERFLREARAVAGVTHPNIVRVFDAGVDQFMVFIAMELCDGPDLEQYLDDLGHRCPIDVAVRIVSDVAAGLQVAHARGLIHRDIKPSNILLDFASSADAADTDRRLDFVPKLTDFGLAKSTADTETLTRTGMMIGTPAYMAPEQAAGDKQPLTPATDVYSLGAVLYHLLCGRPPLRGASELETLQLVVSPKLPIPPTRLRPEVSKDLESVCLRCLAKNPADRYATIEELHDDLEHVLQGRRIRRRRRLAGRSRVRFGKRATAGLVGASAVAIAAVLGLGPQATRWFQRQSVEANSARAGFAREPARDARLAARSTTRGDVGRITADLASLESDSALQDVALDVYTRHDEFLRSTWIDPESGRRHTFMLVDLTDVPTLADAERLCEAIRLDGTAGRLAVIDDDTEHFHAVGESLLDSAILNHDPVVLIGLEWNEDERRWQWITGGPCDGEHWHAGRVPQMAAGRTEAEAVYRFSIPDKRWVWDVRGDGPQTLPTHLLLEFVTGP